MNEWHHAKTGLKTFFVVIPKAGFIDASPAMPSFGIQSAPEESMHLETRRVLRFLILYSALFKCTLSFGGDCNTDYRIQLSSLHSLYFIKDGLAELVSSRPYFGRTVMNILRPVLVWYISYVFMCSCRLPGDSKSIRKKEGKAVLSLETWAKDLLFYLLCQISRIIKITNVTRNL